MAIGERIRFLRNLKGMTQKWLGMAVGFDEKTADVRMAQYESGTRTPKEQLTNALANVLEVSPAALSVPDIDSYVGLMHTLFTLEDTYGIKVEESEGDVCLRVDKSKGTSAVHLHQMLYAWFETARKFNDGDISKEEYDQWRYRYPEFDNTQRWVKIPSQEISDIFTKPSKKHKRK